MDAKFLVLIRRTSIARAGAAMFVALLSVGAYAQELTCNPSITPVGEHNGYKARDKERCEGLYQRLDSGSGLTLVSLVASTTTGALADTLSLHWSLPSVQGLTVPAKLEFLALADPNNLHYRMDAVRATSSNSFSWPTRMLKDLKVDVAQLFILATTPGLDKKYVAVGVGKEPGKRYLFRIRPGSEVISGSYSLKRFDAGQWKVERDALELLEAARPGGAPFPLSIDVASLRPGLYRLELSTTQQVGATPTPSTLKIPFFHG